MSQNRSALLEVEKVVLEKYAAKSDSEFLIKRLQHEKNDDDDSVEVRLPFQHDRDRIIHSRAFRRLMHKTQIFNANKGDHYRNRLTHTLEVSQIARSIGKVLRLNDELIEAISLGHDIGHTPFGHIGERTLHDIISGKSEINSTCFGGFKHNYQSVHIIDNLEYTSQKYDGMNLTLAVRDGILKHTKCNYAGNEIKYTCLNLKHINIDRPSFTLEGQVVAIADEIAQCTHDLEDSVRAGIIKIEDVESEQLIQEVCRKNDIDMKNLKSVVEIRNELIRCMVGFLIHDVCEISDKNLKQEYENKKYPEFTSEEDTYKKQLISFSKEVEDATKQIGAKIKNLVVMSQTISQADEKSAYMIKKMFESYFNHPQQLPDYILQKYFKRRGKELKRSSLHEETSEMKKDGEFIRLICDHIGGMTDQYAAREFKKLFEPEYI